MMPQLAFDFSRVDRQQAVADELAAFCRAKGLAEAAVRLLVHVWRFGKFMNNASAIFMTPAEVAGVIGGSDRHARRVRGELAAAGLLFEVKRGRRMSVLVSWSAVRMSGECPFSWQSDEWREGSVSVPAEKAKGRTEIGSDAVETRSVCGPEPDSNRTLERTSNRTLPQYSEQDSVSGNSIQPQESSARNSEGGKKRLVWGFGVERADLESQEARRQLFEIAKQLNPEMTDCDWAGFVAVCLRAIAEPSRNRARVAKPGGFVLRMVERRGWRIRGRGGVDVEFLDAASKLCEQDANGSVACQASADRWGSDEVAGVVQNVFAIPADMYRRSGADVDARASADAQLAALAAKFGSG